VIRVEVDEAGSVLVRQLPADSVAYVDRDWLPASSSETPALVVDADGGLSWCGGPSVAMPSGADSDSAAALALLAVAEAAAATAEGVPAEAIDVVGSGLIALQVRALLGSSSGSRDARPRVLVDTTGDPAAIVDATRRVAPLGTVVLVGESLGRRAEMNLYPDVHLRGLELVGITSPLQNDAPFADVAAGERHGALAREALATAASGTALPASAAWYRISS
jgi:hypothetical protein